MAGGISARKMAESVKKDANNYLVAMPLQIVIGLSVLLGVFYGGYYYVPDSALLPDSGDLPAKMLYTFRCFLFPAGVMWIAISMVGKKRHEVDALNPLAGNENRMELSKKRLLNTLEQTTIYVMHAMFLATQLKRDEMKLILLYTIAFVVGRFFFWVGYGIGHQYRALGNCVTFGSTYFIQVLSVYLMCSRYLMLSSMIAAISSIAVPTTLVFLQDICAMIAAIFRI